MEFEQKVVDGHNIESLPKWAQCHIYGLELKARVAWDRNEMVQKLNAVMCEPKREWYTIPSPVDLSKYESMQLWVINRDDPRPICSLGKGDLLFIGRALKCLNVKS
jgi:hypothetical protein